MAPSRPTYVVHSGVAPTIRARSALVRAMSALNKWEAHYLADRGPQRVQAYQDLMRAVQEAEAAMAEATGLIGYSRSTDVVGDRSIPLQSESSTDLAAGDHYAGMPGDD